MLTLAIILYVVGAFLRDWDFIWPISALGGAGGCLVQIMGFALALTQLRITGAEQLTSENFGFFCSHG